MNEMESIITTKKNVSADTFNMINSLLIYHIASKVLSPAEINCIIENGSNIISDELSSYLDKKIVNETVNDVSNKISKLIKNSLTGDSKPNN